VSASTDQSPAGPDVVAVSPPTAGRAVSVFLLRVLSALAIPIVAFALMWLTFD
jgi:hypothetical protein